MKAGKQRWTFISYSRKDNVFALRLARELKSAGYLVWLDQLDIAAGTRWDDEVERALRECEIFMIILTPASTSSENVKDEIGYAIDHHKHILPVLLEECDVPLRLRRFQYVDFTQMDFSDGVKRASQLLDNLVRERENPVFPTNSKSEVHAIPRTKATPTPSLSSQKRPSRRRWIFGSAGILALTALLVSIAAILIFRGIIPLQQATETSIPDVPVPLPSVTLAATPEITVGPDLECISTENVDAVNVLSIDPPIGTLLSIGQTYNFVARVKYQLKTRQEAILELSIYNFQDESGLGRAGDNQIMVNQGCEIREITLAKTITADNQTAMKLAVVLRVDNDTLLSDLGFSAPFPVSTSSPVTQEVQWIPDNDGMGTAGLCINDWNQTSTGPICPNIENFVTWDLVKTELEQKVLPFVPNIPSGSILRLKSGPNGEPNWIIQVMDQNGTETANVWIGNDPLNSWRYDGLVRIGYPYNPVVVWATFVRYSDNSYRMK